MLLVNYKGYIGGIRKEQEDEIYFGKVINIKNDIIIFEGQTKEEAHQKFIESIDTYLSYCHKFNQEPENPELVKLDQLS